MATVGRMGMSLLSNNKSFLLLAENLILIVVNDFQMLFRRKGYDLKKPDCYGCCGGCSRQQELG